MSHTLAGESQPRNPPLEYAVAVWLGMPEEEIGRGLSEGWIRHPSLRAPWVHDGAPIPAPDESGNDGDNPSRANERARIHGILRRLDGTLDGSTFEAAWEVAGNDDAARADAFRGFLARTLNVARGATTEDGASRPALVALEAAAAGASGDARFLRLDTLSGRALEELARADHGVRHALAAHENWALTGDRALARLADPEGRYDRFDSDTGEALLSDDWLGDRARHAAWRMASDRGQPLEVDGDGWRFVDRAARVGATLELRAVGGRPVHQVIFARDDGDVVTGGASTDRIHGGRGDDVLRGRAGDDLIEGGAGADVLQGGGGRDQLSGQQGDDDLDGGGGRDRLEGGSGDDTLAGGRGEDLLRGGEGNDSYRFEPGDGADIIDDTGGAILIEDVALAGTMQRDGSGWRSSDGRHRFSLERNGDHDIEGSAVLTITRAGDGGASDSIRVLGWTPGSFGITLGEAEEPVDDHAADPVEGTQAPQRPYSGAEAAHGVLTLGDESDASSSLQPPPASDIAGSDADPGSDAANGPSSPDAGVNGAVEVARTPSQPLFDLSALVADPVDTSTLVDVASLMAALDEGWIASPPDIDAPLATLGIGLTPADVAGALADGSDAADLESDYAPAYDPRGIIEPPRPGDALSVARPELLLRPSPA